MGKRKSAYIGYSEKEVENMEQNYFCIQFGGDFICEDSYYLFTKSEAEKLYKVTLEDLVGIIESGEEKDRKYALDLIMGFLVRPMRLH